MARAESAFGGVDALVNNVGMMSMSDPDAPGSIVALPTVLWHASLERNPTTPFLMIGAVVKGMRVAGYAVAYAGDVAYHAAKAGAVGLTRATASAGTTVNAVAPGWIDTTSASDHERAMRAATPVGRSGTPEEFAWAIASLAGEGASYITGQVITVDGANSISEERGR